MNNDAVSNFFQETRKAFKYLEVDFGYKFISSKIENREHYPDAIAVLRYVGNKIGIEVYWYFASAVINVVLVELLKENEFPLKKRFWGEDGGEAKAIKLHTLVEMKGKGDVFILKRMRSTKLSDIKKREKTINDNLSSVIENLAKILREQAQGILLGNTSLFPDMQKYEEELLKKAYPSLYE